MKRTIAMLKDKKSVNHNKAPQPTVQQLFPVKQASLLDMSYSFLKEAGKPLTGSTLLELLTSKGRKTSRASVFSALYRDVKRKVHRA